MLEFERLFRVLLDAFMAWRILEMKLLRAASTTALIAVSLVSARAVAFAQTGASESDEPKHLTIGPADHAAATHFSNMRLQVLPRKGGRIDPHDIVSVSLGTITSRTAVGVKPSLLNGNTDAAAVPAPGFYPADLSYFGGAVVPSAKSIDIYVDTNPLNAGRPGDFLRDLERSPLIHVLDQYTGSTANLRYSVGGYAGLDYPILATLGDNDLLQIVHAAAGFYGSGYGYIFHVFLPEGVDYCSGGACYSPDNLATFDFCAFHGSVTFGDVGHVLFSLEPYANVLGCSVEQPSPNGGVTDSMANVLSHELSESITDPDGDAWIADSSLIAFGDEIGDLCQSVDPNAPYFQSPISVLNGTPYEVQFEYSNKYHACANVP